MRCPRRSLLAAATAVLAAPALARERFPDRPIRLIVPSAPGGGLDAHLRVMAEIAGRRLGQPVVTDNRPGATATLGVTAMRGARPDGYTITQIPSAAFRIPQMGHAAFDPMSDLSWIIRLSGILMGIVVLADSPIRSMADLIEAARGRGGEMNFASIGVASLQHLVMERIANLAGISWTHVPYRSSMEAITALLGQQVDVAAADSSWAPMVEAGSLRLLATWGEERTARFLAVPTLRESGFDIVANAPYGLVGPRGMEPRIVRILHDALKEALFDPAHLAVLRRFDQPVLYLDSEAYAVAARRQWEDERELLRVTGLLAVQ